MIKVFLSYHHKDRRTAGRVKEYLSPLGMDVFLAHEDLEPSSEWQKEILKGLKGCGVFIPLLTKNFRSSLWTDQETGIAFASNKTILPLKVSADPYGFIGKVQGLSGSLDQPARVASLLSNTLLSHPATHRNMRRGVASAFASADSYVNAISLSKVIAAVKDFAEDEKALIQRACKENYHVFNATGVVSRVCSAIGMPEPNKVADAEDIPF